MTPPVLDSEGSRAMVASGGPPRPFWSMASNKFGFGVILQHSSVPGYEHEAAIREVTFPEEPRLLRHAPGLGSDNHPGAYSEGIRDAAQARSRARIAHFRMADRATAGRGRSAQSHQQP